MQKCGSVENEKYFKVEKQKSVIKTNQGNENQSGQSKPIMAIKANQGNLNQSWQSKPMRAI